MLRRPLRCDALGADGRGAPVRRVGLRRVLDRRREYLDHALLVVGGERRVERQRERPAARVLGYRAQALREPVPLAHVLLEVDARQVARGADALPLELADRALAVNPLI